MYSRAIAAYQALRIVMPSIDYRSHPCGFVMQGIANLKFHLLPRQTILRQTRPCAGLRGDQERQSGEKESFMHDRESHGKPIEDLVTGFRTHLEQGLTQQEAQDRLREFGANELTERPRPGFFALPWDPFHKYLVIILI